MILYLPINPTQDSSFAPLTGLDALESIDFLKGKSDGDIDSLAKEEKVDENGVRVDPGDHTLIDPSFQDHTHGLSGQDPNYLD